MCFPSMSCCRRSTRAFLWKICSHVCVYVAEQASQSGHRQSAMFGKGAICQFRNRSLSVSAAPDARIHRQKQGMMLALAYSVASTVESVLQGSSSSDSLSQAAQLSWFSSLCNPAYLVLWHLDFVQSRTPDARPDTWYVLLAATQVLGVLPRACRLLPSTGWFWSGHSRPSRLPWGSSCLHRYPSESYFLGPCCLYAFHLQHMLGGAAWCFVLCANLHVVAVTMCF